MKTLTLIISLLIATAAQADFKCNTDKATIKVLEDLLGSTVVATLTDQGTLETKVFMGTLVRSRIGSQYSLKDHNGEPAELTEREVALPSKAPKYCGRGSCDIGSGFTYIKAYNFSYKNQSMKFTKCHEI